MINGANFSNFLTTPTPTLIPGVHFKERQLPSITATVHPDPATDPPQSAPPAADLQRPEVVGAHHLWRGGSGGPCGRAPSRTPDPRDLAPGTRTRRRKTSMRTTRTVVHPSGTETKFVRSRLSFTILGYF